MLPEQYQYFSGWLDAQRVTATPAPCLDPILWNPVYSQSQVNWKGPSDVVQSSGRLHCQVEFWVYSRTKTPQPIWVSVAMSDHPHGDLFSLLPLWNFSCSNLLFASSFITVQLLKSLDLSSLYLLLGSSDSRILPARSAFHFWISPAQCLIGCRMLQSPNHYGGLSWAQSSMSKSF